MATTSKHTKRTTTAAKKKVKAKATPAPRPRRPALPTSITLSLDTNAKQRWFASSANEQIRDWAGSEAELVAKACQLHPGYTPEILARQGLRMLAQRVIATATSKRALEAGKGVAGAADERLAETYKQLLSEGAKDITPWILGHRADPIVSYRTARRWMLLHGLLAPTTAEEGTA
ncbi:hypothetical protein EPN44_14170 [bacterium]|nr:MAG: hypothetical protein EPN44_14170 [bacterium]